MGGHLSFLNKYKTTFMKNKIMHGLKNESRISEVLFIYGYDFFLNKELGHYNLEVPPHSKLTADHDKFC